MLNKGRIFAFRWRHRLFLCRACWRRMHDKSGSIGLNERGRLEWTCRDCYYGNVRRAAT